MEGGNVWIKADAEGDALPFVYEGVGTGGGGLTSDEWASQLEAPAHNL